MIIINEDIKKAIETANAEKATPDLYILRVHSLSQYDGHSNINYYKSKILYFYSLTQTRNIIHFNLIIVSFYMSD